MGALADSELLDAGMLGWTNLHPRDMSGGGCMRFQIVDESFQRVLGAFEVNVHPFWFIQNPSGEPVSAGQAKHEWAEADALHDAAHPDGTRGHVALSTAQPLPCQPICIALPSSTRTGTVHCPPVMVS